MEQRRDYTTLLVIGHSFITSASELCKYYYKYFMWRHVILDWTFPAKTESISISGAWNEYETW